MPLLLIKISKILLSVFGRLKSIPHDDPDLTPEKWCREQPCMKIRIASKGSDVLRYPLQHGVGYFPFAVGNRRASCRNKLPGVWLRNQMRWKAGLQLDQLVGGRLPHVTAGQHECDAGRYSIFLHYRNIADSAAVVCISEFPSIRYSYLHRRNSAGKTPHNF